MACPLLPENICSMSLLKLFSAKEAKFLDSNLLNATTILHGVILPRRFPFQYKDKFGFTCVLVVDIVCLFVLSISFKKLESDHKAFFTMKISCPVRKALLSSVTDLLTANCCTSFLPFIWYFQCHLIQSIKEQVQVVIQLVKVRQIASYSYENKITLLYLDYSFLQCQRRIIRKIVYISKNDH